MAYRSWLRQQIELFSLLAQAAGLMILMVASPLKAEPLNQFQAIGSHNSYKKPLSDVVQQWLEQQYPLLAQQITYSHPPLLTQLEWGLRQLEIDVVADPQGGYYAHPWAEDFFQVSLLSPAQRQALQSPGFKVLHIPGLDMASDCVAFADCLSMLRQWSDAHANHFPIMILLNAKENQPDFVKQPAPVPFDNQQYLALDQAIISGLGRQKVFTPDDLRQGESALRTAVIQQGWPDLNELLGKFLFVFDANPKQAERYRLNHPSLQGRSMFASFPMSEDEAAIMVANDPIAQLQQIQRWVEFGFLVRTRADADFTATDKQKSEQFEAAKASGAQWISTDFYPGSPQRSTHQSSLYQVSFDVPTTPNSNNKFLQVNPLFHKNHLNLIHKRKQ